MCGDGIQMQTENVVRVHNKLDKTTNGDENVCENVDRRLTIGLFDLG